MNNKEKDKILKLLKSKDSDEKIYHLNVPKEYQEDIDIINLERKLGERKIINIGFDVINQVYFTNENVLDYNYIKDEEEWINDYKTFETFDEYYDYLNRKIYNNACYYQCDFSTIETKIDLKKLSKNKSFIDYTIDDFKATPSIDDEEKYFEGEVRKDHLMYWENKFVNSNSLDELQLITAMYKESEFYAENKINIDFFVWQYIFHDLNDKKRFNIIMKYIPANFLLDSKFLHPMCHIYDADEVLETYSYPYGTKQTRDKHKRELKKYVESLNQIDNFEKSKTKVFFDSRTHFYCEKNGYGVHRYFETFNELIMYRKNDLTNSDLSNDLYLNYDFSKCKTDETTKLPIVDEKSLKYVISKTYYDNQFQVIQRWYNSNNVLVKHHIHRFSYFFDFIAFLKGDLSEADLLLCDGLINVSDVSGINFQNALIPSIICEKFGIKYNAYELDTSKIESFDNTKDFENDTAIVLQSAREISTTNNYSEISINNYNSKDKIFYISDLHLLHKLEHFQPKSQSDVMYIIQKCVNNIVDETGNILLIGGDISSDYKIFTIFLYLLKREFKRRKRNPVIIFTLGNHELWDFPLLSLNEIIKKYDLLISEHGMHLLHNNVIYIDSDRKLQKISNEDLNSISNAEIREKLKTSRISFFGGIAFSGCNNEFNAENGIYRNTINRQQEIEESKSFKDLYDKILEAIPDKKLVVFTHTPMECWSNKIDYHKDYVYVSGHTHRNYFYDDGETRIYADNQIGYFNNYLHLKWFELDNDYDYFSDYQDGIHEITSEDYQRFYKGKNLPLTFERKICTLYMLKRNGYYCFIHESASGSLTILNGGSLKKLDVWNINYYYEHMDEMIKMIKAPLDKYTSIQKKVSNEIRKIGGTGEIHGCIVDIDYYNHIYVNPTDMKLTCYWASDIINKKIFPNVRTLLKAECPTLYNQYNKLLKESSSNLPVISKEVTIDISVLPQTYLETDIYKVSREIKKMQKLSSNILTTWYNINRDLIETN